MAEGSCCPISASDALSSTATTGELPRVRGIACDAHMPSAYLHPPGRRAQTDRAGLHLHLRLCADKPRCGAAARETCARGSGHGMELHGWPARRHLGVTGPPGGMPAAAQRPRSGGGAWAARLTEGSRRPLSYLVEPPRALADRDAPFSCRLRPRSPRCRGAEHRRLLPLQHFGVSGPEAAESRVRCLFDGGERRLAHHRSHTPQAASPATQPPAYPLEPLTPALPPLSTPPVCSWQANFARSTSSLATILESIVAYSSRCARWCAIFLRPTRPRGTPAAAALLPAAGLPDHVFSSELRVGYRVSRH